MDDRSTAHFCSKLYRNKNIYLTKTTVWDIALKIKFPKKYALHRNGETSNSGNK